ncbi:DNA polymerase III subunit alpha [Flaviflexus salsibiostraticola]|uniref:DNA polymerase III subunit alpha n=1 Tax=Flaviflexus salsibiostraticola TaxID=1282737 RepID=A0A3S8Z663_9ACTO|nr:DNA polymerase III subunit alpha [Flaviflexus salsibiostraticola]AZN28959.1 DNA polymerase III subunit alpha [Flaviflexus salsibiostraticola]
MAIADQDFAHLHVHTEYSMLDGAAKIGKLVDAAVANGQKALAITDHGYLFGAYDFYRTAKKAGIKPIIGIEAYMTPGISRFSKERVRWGTEAQRADDVSANGAYTHMTLLAYSTEGMHNLFRMGSRASLEGQMGKWPRIDRELLESYSTGLIGTAGCPSGEVQVRLRLGQEAEAIRAAGEMQEIFGRENYFVEIMDHDNEIERRVRNELLELAKKIGAPIIATNDSHYVHEDDAKIQDAMLCINSGSTLTDPDRFKFDGHGYHLRSTAEMERLFGDIPGALSNTIAIAERCEMEFVTSADGANFMPEFPTPPGEDETSWFIKEVENGLHERFGERIPADVRARADYEVEVITRMGFPSYFLVVSDYIKWAKSQGIRVGPGRGSGAGSMVAYALQITDLDPIPHGLLFERFLNPERVSMPDIDVDFDERRRNEVIEYVEEKYGKDNVSQVVTYGTIKSKQALKDASRVLGFPFEVGEKLTKAMPPSVQGKDISLGDVFDKGAKRYAEASEFRSFVESTNENREVFELATGLEGLTRQWGVHACAVIMSSRKLEDVIPIMQRPQDGAVITQFEYPQCEELGLLKMDFLGLRNLTVIEDALENIRRNGKEPPVMEEVPFDDREAYELMARAETLGVFQLDGAGMRTLLKQMKPDNFEDISAVSALYRPGPMGAGSHTNYALRKNGLQKITPIHPELEEPLEEILGTTYGLIVYQEQVMQIAQKVAGFSLGKADVLRKAMGKKQLAVLNAQFADFEAGMVANGFSKDTVKTLWDILVPFSEYAFNKSHSAAYGVISYWTAYLKAHYPAEFMAALLTSQKDDKKKLALYLAECRRMGIVVKQPDVNVSAAEFTAVGDAINVGLSAVRNVGMHVVNGIISAREEKGAYTSFQDFLEKVPLPVCNKRAIDSLVKSGAFDSLGQNRRQLALSAEEAIDVVVGVKRNEAAGQFDLFADLGGDVEQFNLVVPDLPEWDKKTKLGFERDMLGLYVSDHPLSGLESAVERAANTTIVSIFEGEERADGEQVTVAGLLTSVETRVSKKSGKLWAQVTLEDLTGSITINVFPATYQKVADQLVVDSVIAIKSRVSNRDGDVQLNAQDVSTVDTSGADERPFDIHLPEERCSEDLMVRLRSLLIDYPGNTPVRLHVKRPSSTVVVAIDRRYHVNAGPALAADVAVLLGQRALG